jgi:hypothetical protein
MNVLQLDKLNVNTLIDDLKVIRSRTSFNGLSKEKTISFINDFILNCDNLLKLDDGYCNCFYQMRLNIPYSLDRGICNT